MSTIGNHILDLLSDDIVSYGLLVQCIEQERARAAGAQPELKDVLEELLSGNVEIGVARSASPDHVEFIAWKGTIGKRLARAAESVENLSGPDREFAYWLCLREHVDRFEEGK